MNIGSQLQLFVRLLKDSFRDLLPIIVVIVFFQLAVLQAVPDNWVGTATGLVIVGIGLAIFLQGLEVGIFPVGENLAKDFAAHGSTKWLLFFGFMIGFGTTIAEPALAVIAEKAASISSGRIDADTLRYVVAGSVGFAILLGVYRIITGHPIQYYIIAGYILVVCTTFFTPPEIVGLAYDLGGVTTSTVTVPLVAALGIGLASSIKGRNPVIDGFGLIAFASLTPMIFVQIYGIVVFATVEAQEVAQVVVEAKVSEAATITLSSILSGILSVSKDVIPILLVIFFFQYSVLKKPLPASELKQIIFGFILVIIGLYAFILGLEMGLFSLGESMAFQLTKLDSVWIIYSFGFAIGFSTTMAEPALMAVAKKAREISDGKINDFALRIFVAGGVAMGIALGSYRIVTGDFIHYYIMAGYVIVIILTMIAPKYIIPIAYDSGGVTTSTVTVPLVAALGIGLATNIEGRSPLLDGFGLIAFASLFPMITVMLYGIISERFGSVAENAEKDVAHDEFDEFDSEHTIVNSHDSSTVHHLKIEFDAVVAIIPEGEKEHALNVAREAGASGVTIMDGQGMGIQEMVSFYRTSAEVQDSVLLFILPSTLSKRVVNNLTRKLHLTTTGDGIVFSMPISNLRGISVDQKHIFEHEVEDIKKAPVENKAEATPEATK
jgi:nitrogen regulatory protein PII